VEAVMSDENRGIKGGKGKTYGCRRTWENQRAGVSINDEEEEEEEESAWCVWAICGYGDRFVITLNVQFSADRDEERHTMIQVPSMLLFNSSDRQTAQTKTRR
jgi:hypothetical protein